MNDYQRGLLRAAEICKKLSDDDSAHVGLDLYQQGAHDCVEAIRAEAEVPPQHSDDIAVDKFAAAMKAKLAEKRSEGRSGWNDPNQCSIDYLLQLFYEQVDKGDPVDVANLSMMLWCRIEATNLKGREKRLPQIQRAEAEKNADGQAEVLNGKDTSTDTVASPAPSAPAQGPVAEADVLATDFDGNPWIHPIAGKTIPLGAKLYLAPEPANPVAWMLRKKSNGFIRGLTASPPSDETLQIADIDGDEWVPLYLAPQPYKEDADMISINPNKPVELLFTENDIYVSTDVKHPTLFGKIALVVRKDQAMLIKNALQDSDAAAGELIWKIASEAQEHWLATGKTPSGIADWAIREYLKRREGK